MQPGTAAVQPLVTGARPMGPCKAAWAGAALQVLASTGPCRDERGALLTLVNAYVRGASVDMGRRAPTPEALESSGREGNYPLLRELLSDPCPGTTVRRRPIPSSTSASSDCS